MDRFVESIYSVYAVIVLWIHNGRVVCKPEVHVLFLFLALCNILTCLGKRTIFAKSDVFVNCVCWFLLTRVTYKSLYSC